MSLHMALKTVLQGQTLDEDTMCAALGELMRGEADPIQAAGLLCALAARGEHLDEVVGAARAMREALVPFESPHAAYAVDTCGTGGDGSGTFNISTSSAFVVAACGAYVIKHGNRAVSSSSGSADLLQHLGANIQLDPRSMSEVLDETRLAFLFAPTYHPAMRHAVPIRKRLAVRTLFNLLGPLCNPASVPHQVLGVFDARWLSLARALRRLGVGRSMVVHGHGGLDELSLTGPTRVAFLDGPDGEVHQQTFHPKDAGLSLCALEDLRGAGPAENAARLRRLFSDPDESKTPLAQAVQLNAGAALFVAGHSASIREGVAMARDAMVGGAALGTLDAFVEATRARS